MPELKKDVKTSAVLPLILLIIGGCTTTNTQKKVLQGRKFYEN
jgi:hypothetical protein